MTFVYESKNTKDNEQRSLRPDQNGDAARNIVGPQLADILDAINTAQNNTKATPKITNLNMLSADTEYSHTFLDNTNAYTIRAREYNDVRMAFTSGQAGLGSGVLASQTLDDSFNSIFLGDKKGQNFTPTASDLVKKVTLKLKAFTGVGNIYVTINNTSGGVPGGTVLATSDLIPITSLINSYQDIDFIFSTPTSVISGGSYSWVLHTDALSSVSSFAIRLDTTQPYAFSSGASDSGGGWSLSPFDYYFIIDSGSGGEYLTLKRGSVYSEENLDIIGKTLYVQSSTASTTLEILEWT